MIAGICVAALAVLVVLAVMITGFVLTKSDTVFPNVCVSGVNIGGMNRQEAVAALDNALATTHSTRTLTVQLPDRKLVFDPELTNSPLDTDAMVDTAMAYGRSGSPYQVLMNYVKCKKVPCILDPGEAMEVDQSYIRDLINKTADDVYREMIQSEITMDEEAKIITIQLGYTGRSLDAERLYEAVMAAYNSGNLSDINFQYQITPYSLVDLQPYYSKYCIPAQDAYYDTTSRTLVEEVIGYGFDLMAVNQQIALAEEGSVIEVPLQTVQPKITVENWKATNFPDVLASYSSPHTSDRNRTTNLKVACEAINGTVLNPGEVFSFNGIVGERTAEKGYKPGIIYADGGASEAELGGGVCQVASTIYMCVLLADLEVQERAPHMFTVSYVPMGMDATIYWGSLDFKFKNSNSTPIMINASVSNGKVHISIEGIMEHDYTVKMSYEVTSTTQWEEVEEVDETKPFGFREEKHTPYTGYTVWSYKTFYDLNGNKLGDKQKYAFSEYQKRDHVFVVGPEDPSLLPPEEEGGLFPDWPTYEPPEQDPSSSLKPLIPPGQEGSPFIQ